MIKRYKALIKHEIKAVSWIELYFLIVALFVIGQSSLIMKDSYIDNLKTGLSSNRMSNLFISSITWGGTVFLILSMIGVVLLAYFQFKDIKGGKVGRFLKALPFTNADYLKVKVVLGIISYTIPFLLYGIGICIIKGMHSTWIRSYYEASGLTELMVKTDGTAVLLSLLGLYYLVITATYLFFLLMQYLMSNGIVATIIGGIVFHAPAYILWSIYSIYSGSRDWRMSRLTSMVQDSVLWTYGNPNMIMVEQDYWELYSKFREVLVPRMRYRITGINGIEFKLVFCIVLIVLLAVAVYFTSKKYRVENADTLIVFKSVRIIFIVGVTICSLFVLPLFYLGFLQGLFEVSFIGIHIIMAISGLIGYLIAIKVANIGVKR